MNTQIKLQKNNYDVLDMLIANGSEIELTKEDFYDTFEDDKDFFTLQTSSEEFKLDIQVIEKEFFNAKNILISFSNDISLDKIRDCIKFVDTKILDDTILKFGTRVSLLSKNAITIFFNGMHNHKNKFNYKNFIIQKEVNNTRFQSLMIYYPKSYKLILVEPYLKIIEQSSIGNIANHKFGLCTTDNKYIVDIEEIANKKLSEFIKLYHLYERK